MRNIEDKIITAKPREEAGAKTSRKYIFQKDLSLYLLLLAHEKKDDYLFLFDFHEDLIISNSSTAFSDLEFFQIKSKDSGNWTNGFLTKVDVKSSSSILGKLYNNKIVFEDVVKSLNLISNANFSLGKLNDGSDSTTKTFIEAKNLSPVNIKIHEDSIKKEHRLTNTEYKKLTCFIVTELSNRDSSTHCIGALATLINKLNPHNSINSGLAYSQVMNEITRRTTATIGDKTFQSISEIFDLKGISKSQFLSFLQKASLYKSVADEWSEVKSSLESLSVPYVEVLRFKAAWRGMSAHLIKDSHSIPLRDTRNSISDVIRTRKEKFNSMTLIQIVDEVFDSVAGRDQFDEYFVKCLIINSLNEA